MVLAWGAIAVTCAFTQAVWGFQGGGSAMPSPGQNWRRLGCLHYGDGDDMGLMLGWASFGLETVGRKLVLRGMWEGAEQSGLGMGRRCTNGGETDLRHRLLPGHWGLKGAAGTLIALNNGCGHEDFTASNIS
ncbi:hypothetical protein VPH35_044519 [Triticum aestivum]|uniref:Uncharacterized protein n=1 Tax=Triticum turgidum subsp. durum TaxID=4567 RepID=A0A9R0RJR2_TRITD|nr:unnamed protein product [Triticum turgidum subsp. durum]